MVRAGHGGRGEGLMGEALRDRQPSFSPCLTRFSSNHFCEQCCHK